MNMASGREPQAEGDVNALLAWVSMRTGLSFRSQSDNARAAVQRFLRATPTSSLEDAKQRLESDQASFDDLVGKLTVGETYFFRHEAQFDMIATSFLEFVKTHRPADHRIRVWSAGCATGEEVWSLAALFAASEVADRSHVLGTDISRSALLHARRGHYRRWSLRGQAGERMQPWLRNVEHGVRPVESLESMVSFEYLNLAEDAYPSLATHTLGLDLILCRNVLIYFDRQTIDSVADRFFRSLAPGGWLLTGASDPNLAHSAPFEIHGTPAGIVYRRPAESVAAKAQPTAPAPAPRAQPQIPSKREPVTAPAASGAPLTSDGRVAAAACALTAGNYERVLSLTQDQARDCECCILRTRALANLDPSRAEEFCTQATRLHPTNIELHYLRTVLLAELGRYEDAAEAGRRVVFLDRNLAVGHMALGTIWHRLGDTRSARRAFRNAIRICEALPAAEFVRLSDGETAQRLAESAVRHLELLDDLAN